VCGGPPHIFAGYAAHMLRPTATPGLKDVLRNVLVRPGKRFRLKDYSSEWVPGGTVGEALSTLEEEEIKDRAKEIIRSNVSELADAQELLWASDTHAVLVVFQAMDAAGKDGTIKHVTSGLNPTGCEVVSFKAPSAEELDHTYLWRVQRAVPERGKIVIFNRSHYEDVLVVRVRPDLLEKSQLPRESIGPRLWKQRFEDINAFEQHLSRNGTLILKFFLNVSKQEQRRRFLDRLKDPSKRWKFALADLDARARWAEYMRAYEEAIGATSTPWAPWHIIPADHKWVMRAMVAAIMSNAIRSLPLRYPRVSRKQAKSLRKAMRRLEREG